VGVSRLAAAALLAVGFAAGACSSTAQAPHAVTPTTATVADTTSTSLAPAGSATPAPSAPAPSAPAPSAPALVTPAPSAPPASPASSAAGLPDPAFTPGATDPAVTQATIDRTICVSGWTTSVRPPESYTEDIKHLEAGGGGTVTYDGVAYPVHGFELADPDISHYELDHLIPLEIGGSPADPRNLWMEAYERPKGSASPGTGSQTKDKVENAAREAVCAGRLALADAQQRMRTDWPALGQRLGVLGTG